ncbi:MAG: hypothetical protein KC466_07095 [Myxococcales bacterium]|nr:hypothetical protein [Myxococcales bacterium]
MDVDLSIRELRKVLAGFESAILRLSFKPADDEDLWLRIHHRDRPEPIARLALNTRMALAREGAAPAPDRLTDAERSEVLHYYREFIVTILRGDAGARERTVLAAEVRLVD